MVGKGRHLGLGFADKVTVKWLSLLALQALAAGAATVPAPQIAPPVVQWQQSFGGTNWDEGGMIRQTPDGGYLVAASSYSPPGGNKTSEHFGGYDFWLLRLDGSGNKLWERTFGGTNNDYVSDLRVTADGGFVVAGWSASAANSVKSGTNFGSEDFWLLRLDADGNKIWDKTFGGIASDRANAVTQLSDGGFVVAGTSGSPASGNKSSPHFGGSDYWVVRTDADGDLLWDRSFGGTGLEECISLCQMASGNIAIGGYSLSGVNGNKSSPHLGGTDFWLVTLNVAGDKLWDKAYGGSAYEECHRLVPLLGGGLGLVGPSGSLPGPNKDAPYFGGANPNGWPNGDFWLVKTDDAGARIADQSFGGEGTDLPWDVIATSDGGFVVCGMSPSGISGNKTSPGYGSGDAWLIRTDSNLNRLWELSLGGSRGEYASSIRQTSDGGFIVACLSSSGADGIKTTPAFGNGDLWIVKLGPDALTAPQLRALPQRADTIRQIGFRLELRAPLNAAPTVRYLLEASTDRTNWTVIQTNLLKPGTSAIDLVDPSAAKLPARAYRARMER